MSTVKFLIAQHVPNIFRCEPRNIGVVVAKEGAVDARFFGETSPGVLDGRRLRPFQYPDVYRQWVEYWRRCLVKGEASLDEILSTSGQHFRVLLGGELTDTDSDILEDIANYTYSLLVSEGGLGEALGGKEEEEVALKQLNDEISTELSQAKVLAFGDDELPFVRHPVRRAVEVRGRATEPHRPAFAQHNGALYVIETVDFTTAHKTRPRDHAGLAAYMFKDIVETSREKVEPRTIVRVRPEDEGEEAVRYALAILRNESAVVNWLDPKERDEFIRERVTVAHSL